MVDWDARTDLCAGIFLPEQRGAAVCKVALWLESVCPVLCRFLRYMVSDRGDFNLDGLLLACMREYLMWPKQNHWSECVRATSVASSDALGRPHRSAFSFAD